MNKEKNKTGWGRSYYNKEGTMEKESLSDKAYWEHGKQDRFYLEKDVKEAVNELIKFAEKQFVNYEMIIKEIKRIFGEKLYKENGNV